MKEADDVAQYYISGVLATNDLKGFGPFIMASVEYEKAMC